MTQSCTLYSHHPRRLPTMLSTLKSIASELNPGTKRVSHRSAIRKTTYYYFIKIKEKDNIQSRRMLHTVCVSAHLNAR